MRKPIDLHAIHAYFKRLEQQDRYSGVVLITQDRSELFSAAYGYANRAWKVKPTLETRFDTASITKLFTAMAALQLVDQGRLSLDTPAVDYLGLQGTAISPDATLFHLLTHSSGIADDADEEAGEDYADLWINKANYSVTQAVDFLPQFAHKPANFPPGQGARYCNCAFVLAGLMIEKASGMPYRDFVQQNIFAPSGMTRSGFFRMDEVTEDLAEGSDPIYDPQGHLTGWKKNIYSFPPIGTPDGGAHVTAGDLVRFLHAAQDGKLLGPDSTNKFFTPQVFKAERKSFDHYFGFGLEFLLEKNSHKVIAYHKDGQNAGVSGIIRHMVETNISMVLLSNMEDGVWEPVWEIYDMLNP